MLGWDLFTLSCSVSWPLSLVVAPRQHSQYQLLFKHIFTLQHVQRQLALAWQTMQGTRRVSRCGPSIVGCLYAAAVLLVVPMLFAILLLQTARRRNESVVDDKSCKRVLADLSGTGR